MLLGLNCTSGWIHIAYTEGLGSEFRIVSTQRIAYSVETSADILSLRGALLPVFEEVKKGGVPKVAVLRCFSGLRGSSVEAIKSEGICELVLSLSGVEFVRIAPQSLPAAVGCTSKQKWQDRARQLFNPEGKIKYWQQGAVGAVAAAYKAAKQ